MLNKIKKLFLDEHDDADNRELRELRKATAECAALVRGIRYYASMPDSQESRQRILDLTDTSWYGERYLRYVEGMEEELRILKGGRENEPDSVSTAGR